MVEWLTGVLVIVTGVYAWITFRILKVNERTLGFVSDQTEAISRPYVTVAVLTVPNSPMFYLRIANTGRTGATEVRLEMDRDYFDNGRKDGRNLRTLTAFQQPIGELAPGSELVFMLGSAVTVFAKDTDPAITPQVFEVRVPYRYGGKQVAETTVIDLRPYFLSIDRPDPLIDEIQAIRKELEKIAQRR